jgi:hypothetical protein
MRKTSFLSSSHPSSTTPSLFLFLFHFIYL